MKVFFSKTTKQFDRDYKKILKSGNKDINKLEVVILQLESGKVLEPKYKDHKLLGEYKGRRECHIEPDWLLIYKYIGENIIVFERTGSHAELFK